MAVAAAARECIWLTNVVKDLDLPDPPAFPIGIYEDNEPAIALSKNPVAHSRNKHIDVKHHFIREQVNSNKIELIPIASKNNLADVFTKTSHISIDEFAIYLEMLLTSAIELDMEAAKENMRNKTGDRNQGGC